MAVYLINEEMALSMAKTIKEERLRWVLPIVKKEVKLVRAAKVCPYSKRSLEREDVIVSSASVKRGLWRYSITRFSRWKKGTRSPSGRCLKNLALWFKSIPRKKASLPSTFMPMHCFTFATYVAKVKRLVLLHPGSLFIERRAPGLRRA